MLFLHESTLGSHGFGQNSNISLKFIKNVLLKKVLLKISQIQSKALVLESLFFNKVAVQS